MAKINARGTRQVGPTLFTEKTITFADEGARVYYEGWRLRSDGAVLTRIIRTRPAEGSETNQWGATEHRGSAYRIFGRISLESVKQGTGPADLRSYLERKGYTIVKEVY